MYQHKSGSLKRKEKREREQEEEKLRNKNVLLKFFKKQKSPEEASTAEAVEPPEKEVLAEPEEETASCSTSFVTDTEGHTDTYPQEEDETQTEYISGLVENEEEPDWKDPAVWPDVLTDKHRESIVICGLDKEQQLQEMIKGMDKDCEERSFKRLLDVTLFLASRNLAFRGSSQRIGDLHNGNFLGVLELIAHPMLNEHLEKVKRSQESGRKVHAHYLSWATQNEFINICGKHVLDTILSERRNAIYFSLICDATPDISHTEQNVIVLRYVHRNSETENWVIQERFIEFFDFHQKTGEEIAEKLLLRLAEHGINLDDCRGQGFDNGANMSGKNKGVRAHIQKKFPKAVFCPCASHSLNLAGVHAASCCPDVITFFGCVNRLYLLFSGSPQRWKILKDEIGSSLHALSDTRWSARVEAVRPIALRLPGIIQALEKVISSQRLSILQSFEERNKILQARSISMDIGRENIKSLSLEMQALHDRWTDLLSEAKLVAEEMGIPKILKAPRRLNRSRKQQPDVSCIEPEEAEMEFKINVFFVALDSIISELNQRFQSMEKVCCLFTPILKLKTLSDAELVSSTENLISYYSDDLSSSLVGELQHLRKVYDATFTRDLAPLDLLNAIHKLQLEGIFGEISIALRIFTTIPLSVPEGERAFSKLSLIKNYLRSTMSEQRLNSLALLSIEHELARKLSFKDLIEDFASLKLRRWSTHHS
ncbi:52 kDa repressor of the inhibitor of the protein kinase-like [Bufo gargarizans]|uniref:52 kDa repressor of the inhibitor of the protein kinase-like n=1 Tax=Bufo gargarizans TaxID=30331 RepID=UPI001CF39542|nr:52 kDa repressor of the inhibitor of the protein kinase-like [Bufo gargarizans]